MKKNIAVVSVGLVLSTFGGGLPYAFEYGGRAYRGYEGVIDGALKVSVERQAFPDFPGADWYTVWFENVGDRPTAVLKDIVSLDAVFAGEKPVLSGILGDHKNLYRPYVHDFAKDGAKEFVSLEGRATHVVFPYFNLTHGDGGTLLALGWAGTWKAEFTPVADGVRLVGRNSVGFESQLLPGEKVRSALVARIPYAGRGEQAAMNVWRRFYMRHVLPKNADGSDLKPLTAAGFAGDTGLPNSDGSISERSFTWQPTLQKLIDEKVVPDFRWFDAGWYYDPSGKTVPTLWWHTVGTWELDREKWPGNSFRESNEACHRAGMKVFMWFEPERVTHLDELTKNYGYKREWSVEGRVCTSDLGNPECFKWTLDRILKTMDDGAVDMYREDNNSDPAGAWKVFDQRTAEATGLVRTGISENRGIQGHYALWDGIIAHCKATGRCPYVDSCASGGGRNDLESMRRGFPMMRSDFDRTTTALRLSMSWGFNKWIPFHGTATKETQGQLDVANQFADEYVSRASLLPVYAYHESFSRNKNLDFDILRRNLAEWRSVADLLTKDFYTLTPWRAPNDRTGWTVFAYRDPATKRAELLAFRQEDCKEATCEVTLPFETDPAKRTLTLKLDQPRSSLLMELGAEAKPEDWNLAARQKFAEQRFGIFLHWGIYATYAQGALYQETVPLDPETYGRAMYGFCPSKFDAKEWVRVFKRAGAKYVTITSRHHDGFSLWPTKVDDGYNVANTPFKRDILGELAAACKEEGLQLNFYYSLMDWHRADYPAGSRARRVFGPQAGDYGSYKRFMLGQIGELIDRYRPGVIWLDGEWDHTQVESDGSWTRTLDWDFDSIYDLIHSKRTLVANNNHQPIRAKEDIQLFERDLPGEGTMFSRDQPLVRDRPLEQCDVIQYDVWGYKIAERRFRTADDVVRVLVCAAANDSNLLMNIGPDASGQLPAKAVEVMAEVGKWMDRNGESVYGTRAGGVSRAKDVVSTRKGDVLYLHFLNPSVGTISFALDGAIASAAVLGRDDVPLTADRAASGEATVTIVRPPNDPFDIVVKLTVR